MKSYKKRLTSVRQFTAKNRLFSLIAIALLLFLTGNAVYHRIGENKSQPVVPETEITDTDPEHWRFYPVDLAVLIIVGGFCTMMILRERKKAREKLT